jgi:hypothetical protein
VVGDRGDGGRERAVVVAAAVVGEPVVVAVDRDGGCRDGSRGCAPTIVGPAGVAGVPQRRGGRGGAPLLVRPVALARRPWGPSSRGRRMAVVSVAQR